jgi:hypothetical protein
MLWQQGETVCDSIDQWEITDCLVPASTSSCKVRCYFPYDNGLMTEATAPDSQVAHSLRELYSFPLLSVEKFITPA